MKNMSMIGLPFYSLAEYRGMGMAVGVLRNLGIADAVKQQVESFNDLADVKLSEIGANSGTSNLRNFGQFLRDTYGSASIEQGRFR